MLYYLKALEYETFSSARGIEARFHVEVNTYTEHYTSRTLHGKAHYWTTYGSEFCLCCPVMKKRWNYNLRWIPVE